MFIESRHVRQILGEAKRRWFTADSLELIVWVEQDDTIVGFQLCYETSGNPKAVTWNLSSGYLFSGIDDGDVRFGKHKQSPILVANGRFQKGEILALFTSHSEGLPEEYGRFVISKLEEYCSKE